MYNYEKIIKELEQYVPDFSLCVGRAIEGAMRHDDVKMIYNIARFFDVDNWTARKMCEEISA